MKSTKKDFTKFTKRNTHKRRGKEAAKQELLTTDIELSPVYLRASQAERERLERLEAEKKGKE